MQHRRNQTIVRLFLKANPNSGYSYWEIARKTEVSLSSVKGIVQSLKRRGFVDRFLQRERKRLDNGALKVQNVAYFAWKPKKKEA